ncbi:G-type lectin S-receptor-like serine/threonine-protein kinase LECRK3 [Cajanus cajan]|uniref:G-type lectin S-receptor-like serine/threonine-protein kinase LECRK3 n=1 Tax=Cajanus cajan TaxID=3821 RepID=UPI00098D8805|nr:G-type lectin S-receptor-like serine/threonine-protein kinase LECRK3 [Cajanus cajan]
MAALTLFIPALVFLQALLVSANIDLNTPLYTGEKSAWRSPSGEFAFGFYQLNNDTDRNTTGFMVAIWYDMIPNKTVVWSAKTGYTLETASPGSYVQINEEGLWLIRPEGNNNMKIASPQTVVTGGAMLDTGNFVLLDGNSEYVWQSFHNPSDTLLPSQSLSLQLNAKLTSRFSDSNYAVGRFQLYFDHGNVLLSPIASQLGYNYNSYYVLNVSGNASQLVFDKSGDIYVDTKNGTRVRPQGQKWFNLTLDPKENYYRATLDFNGVLTQYAHPRNNSTGWTIVRYVPENICNAIFNDYGSGSCGYNSYCSMENDRPTCKCPYGYSFVDPINKFGGCQPNLTIGCGADVQARPEELYEMNLAKNFNFPLGDYEKIQPSSQQQCAESCLRDCMCAVAILGGNTCWKKRLPLGNGREVEVTDKHFVYIKTRIRGDANGELPSAPDSKKEDRAKPILLGSLIASLVVISILLVVVAFLILLKPEVKRVVQAASLLETNLHWFSYEALKEATWGFSEELGRGSCAIVYKGKLEGASCNVVAVKRLDRLAQEREKEFRTELSSIGKTCHKNLVRLIGFCDEGTHRLLVYEFMSGGTLAGVLFGQSKPNWNIRVGSALGIARGLVYLHEECDPSIIHCDIKPQNILIDEHFNVKISDFGLAKLLSDQSRTNTMIRGTRGYVAPEWFKNVAVTVKVDVYSFGVMLLEIICCRRSVLKMETGEEEKAILTDWAYDCYLEGRINAMVEKDEEALSDNGRLQRWVKIAIWCIHEQPEMRPTMGMVMQMLEGVIEVPNPPPPFPIHSIP